MHHTFDGFKETTLVLASCLLRYCTDFMLCGVELSFAAYFSSALFSDALQHDRHEYLLLCNFVDNKLLFCETDVYCITVMYSVRVANSHT